MALGSACADSSRPSAAVPPGMVIKVDETPAAGEPREAVTVEETPQINPSSSSDPTLRGLPTADPEPTATFERGLRILNITDSGDSARYSKFEITFDVGLDPSNSDVNPQLPYDPDLPPGLGPGSGNPLHNGISVDAIFTSPAGETFQQPAFIYQPYEDNGGEPKEHWSQSNSQQEWYYPVGQKVWKVRFAPHEPGNWSYTLTVNDASGSAQSAARSFSVADSDKQGFIKVSPTDSRYFEYDSGALFISQGGQIGVRLDRPILANKAVFESLRQNEVRLVRQWFSGFPGVAWPMWGILGGDAAVNVGYLPRVAFLPTEAVGDYPVMTWQLDYEAGDVGWFGACVFKIYEDSEAVKRNTYYKLQVTYAADHIHQDPRIAGEPHGVVAKITPWWRDDCAQPGGEDPAITDYGLNTGGEWEVLQGVWNSSDNNFLPRVYVSLENVQSAQNADGTGAAHDGTADLETRAKANILSVSLKECLDGAPCRDTSGPEIIDEYSMQYGLYFSDTSAQAMDKVVELAEANGIAIKLVVLDKDDNLFYKIDDDGSFVLNGESDNNSENRQDPGVYGCSAAESGPAVCPQGARTLNKTRWLQEAYYRYLQARWGYSTAIHSWEFTNEGDPNSEQHWQTADEFGKAMHCRVFGVEVERSDGVECALDHPNAHLVTTSFWHSFPAAGPEKGGFWGSPLYPNIDYADGHAYVSTSPASQEDKRLFEADAAYYHLWHAEEWGGRDLPYPIMRGEAGMVPAEGDTNVVDGLGIQNDLQGIWYHNFVWAGLHPGALYEVYWYYREHILDPPQIDHQYHQRHFVNFLRDVPLSNGHYEDLAAEVSNPDLRVVGQKDLQNGRAHAWIQNRAHSWKNVTGGLPIPPVSGTVSISGFAPDTVCAVKWWNTYSGQIDRLEAVKTDEQGRLQLAVKELADDVALKIGDARGGCAAPVS
jgi:hypothetical protein